MIRKIILSLALTSALTACSEHAEPSSIVLINVFTVAPGQDAQALAAWRASRDFLRTQPGYLSTQLHQNMDKNSEFQLINIAHWRSVADFNAAVARMRHALPNPLPHGVQAHPGLYRLIEEDQR